MATFSERDQAKLFVLLFSLASLFGCLAILGSFKVSKEWRLGFSSRFLLLGMTIYTICFSLSYLIFMDSTESQMACNIQGAAIQYFGMGMAMHQAMISYELYKETKQLTHQAEDPSGPPPSIISEDDGTDISFADMWAQVRRKYWIFEFVVCLSNLLCVIFLVRRQDAIPTPGADFSCTITGEGNNFQLMLELLPGYISVLVVLLCDFAVLYRLFKLLGRRDTFLYTAEISAMGNGAAVAAAAVERRSWADAARSPSDADILVSYSSEHQRQPWFVGMWLNNFLDSFSRLDDRSRATVLRLLITPLFYLALGIALPVVWMWDSGSMAYVLLTELCGVANFIGWVLLDKPLCRQWLLMLRLNLGCQLCSTKEGTSGVELMSGVPLSDDKAMSSQIL